MAEAELHGVWARPFGCRVVWALKLKGISYEYVEEDLSNKSPLLLQYDPVHKRIPILVHDGQAICESMVIMECLEEKWPTSRPLLPTDPFERAAARFWVKFFEDKGPAIWRAFCSHGEEQEKPVKESLEMLKAMEEYGLGEKKFFGGDEINIMDIACDPIVHWLGVIEEIIGVKLLEPHKFPKLNAWVENFKENATIKENLPDRVKMLALYRQFRQMLPASA